MISTGRVETTVVSSDILYKKNFLTNVLARMDFISPMRELNTELPADVSKSALANFPIAEPQKAIATQLQLTQEDFQQSKEEFMQWIFHGKDREKKLTILPASIFVEYTKYSNYSELRNQFLQVLQSLLNSFGNFVCSRIGLRYINNIALENSENPLSWEGLLHEKLLSPLSFYPESQFISRAFHNLELNFGDFNLRYQFGIINPDYPATVKKKSFILDLDAYSQGGIDRNSIASTLDIFHDRIQSIFELSITPKMRNILNE